MSNAERFEIVRRAAPLDLEAIADTTYTGVDLSMPALFHRLFWRSFRKTFHRDPASGVLRGASWMTRARCKHPRARRFAAPQLDTPFCGFRSCAL